MRDELRYKEYQKLYRSTKIWKCPVCEIEMIIGKKYRHLKSEAHVSLVECIESNGEVPPVMREKQIYDGWTCPICDDNYFYRNKYQHVKTNYHIQKLNILKKKGLPIKNIYVNEKLEVS